MDRPQTATKLPFDDPAQFTLTTLRSTGQFQNDYPTFSISYVGRNSVPDENILVDIQAFSSPFTAGSDKECELELVAFFQPKQELLGFAHSGYFTAIVNTREANDFFRRIGDLGRYMVLINTDTYTYKALVDDASGEVVEASIEHRFLN